MVSKNQQRSLRSLVLLMGYGTMLFLSAQGGAWLEASSGFTQGALFIWIFAAILLTSFSIVYHADILAEKLGEPYGTLILTLAVTGIEVMMISAVMLTDTSPTLARDTMFSVVMILLGGILGFCLLIGGFRFHEQHFNLKGGKAFLSLIIPLTLLSLVMPNFTIGGHGFFSNFHALSIVILSTVIYSIFLAVQTKWHTEFFLESSILYLHQKRERSPSHPLSVRKERLLVFFHTMMLLLYIPIVIVLSKKLALLFSLKQTQAASLAVGSGKNVFDGLIVAILILAPEGLAAIQAARKNQMQRSVNILLGSVLATIGLTVPAALGISLFTGQPIHLGLNPADITLLAMTLSSCIITFSQGETNAFQGFVHLLLFAIYIVLMFN
jgi:Ca2+:H+ antiporter